MPTNIDGNRNRATRVQRVVQPSAGSDAATGAHTGSGDAGPAGPNAPSARDRRGRFLPGNSAAVQHALHTDRLPAELTHLRTEVNAFVNGCESDEGGALDQIPARRRAQLEYRARVHRRILQIDSALEARGLVDKRGKLRTAWLQRLEGLIATAIRIDTMLGLERRPKDAHDIATLSAAEYVARTTSDDVQTSAHHESE